MNLFKSFVSFLKNLGKKAPSISATHVYEPAVPSPVVPPVAVPTPAVIPAKENRVVLYETALGFIGVDASPNDMAPDELGCADTVCSILEAAFPNNAGFPHVISTTQLYRSLQNSPLYEMVTAPLHGDIVISPTGYGNGSLANGHVGIKGMGLNILSNSSASGDFISNFTMDSWRARYVTKGGFPMVFYRRK